MNSKLFFGFLFVLMVGSVTSAQAEQCDTYQRDDGKIICVSENTAQKLLDRGWDLTKIEPEIIIPKIQPQVNQTIPITHTDVKNVIPEILVLDLSSSVDVADEDTKEEENPKLATYAEYKKKWDNNFQLFSGVGWVDMSERSRDVIIYSQDPKTGKTFLDLDAMFDKKPVVIPEHSLISVQIDKTKYDYGDTIHVKGKVSDIISSYFKYGVSVQISYNDIPRFNDNYFTMLNPDGSYEMTINLSNSKWFNKGIYTLTAIPGGVTQASTEFELVSAFTPYQKPINPNDTVLDLSSPVEFEDDGREIKRAVLRKSPAPLPIYDRIMDGMGNTILSEGSSVTTLTTGVQVNALGVVSFKTTPHEKYSINPKQGLYFEDWLPTYIPDGQKLLYSTTTYTTFMVNEREYESYSMGYTFVPTTFVLQPGMTSYDLEVSKGFTVGIEYSTLTHDEVEDGIELIKESRAKDSGNYGRGFVDITRDDKIVFAYEGGSKYYHYQANLNYLPDENTSVGVSSNYHTLDELIPIFNSIMK